MLLGQGSNSLEKKGLGKSCDEKKRQLRIPHPDGDVRKKKVVRLRTYKDGMPIKRSQRILIGTCLTVVVVCPIVLSIALRTAYDDSTKYIFHQVMCSTQKNQLRVIQVHIDMCHQELKNCLRLLNIYI